IEIEVQHDLEAARSKPFRKPYGFPSQRRFLGYYDEMYLIPFPVFFGCAQKGFDVDREPGRRRVVAVLPHELVVTSSPYERGHDVARDDLERHASVVIKAPYLGEVYVYLALGLIVVDDAQHAFEFIHVFSDGRDFLSLGQNVSSAEEFGELQNRVFNILGSVRFTDSPGQGFLVFFFKRLFDAFSQLACLRQEVSQDSRVSDVEHEVLDPRFPERLHPQGYYFSIGFRCGEPDELASDLEYFPLLAAPLFFEPYDPAVVTESERCGMVLHLSRDYPSYLRRNVGPQRHDVSRGRVDELHDLAFQFVTESHR